MRLEKAIEIVAFKVRLGSFPIDPDETTAIKLCLEAAKYVHSQYDPDHQMMRIPLPGETRD